MSFRFAPDPARYLTVLAPLGLSLLLAACGSGGGGSADTTTPGFSTEPKLSGVLAVGSPLLGAQVSVVDGTGAAVGSATAHPVDGSYSLTLTTKTPTAPLLVQARGMDAAGNMQVLHSVAPVLAATMVANVTTLSNASLAMQLGTDPATVFAAAKTSASTITGLTALTPAADFLKTLIKNNLTDVKITTPASLDLFNDAGFSATKGAQDLLLEGLRVHLVHNTKGAEELHLSNKLLPSSAPEVVVDLATAKTELAKTTDAAPANAITSTLKGTTSATATMLLLGNLDDLSAALNKLIATGLTATTAAASPLVSGYDTYNGRNKGTLAILLADLASKNRQFGRWQLTGCADDTLATGGSCSRVLVSAPITDSSGAVVEIYNDAVKYTKAPAAGVPNWSLIGNGKPLEFAIHPLLWTEFAADGAVSASLPLNPIPGVQVLLGSYNADSPPVKQLDSATVQTPGGFSMALAQCTLNYLCLSATPGSTSTAASGGAGDHVLRRGTLGWIGAADVLKGAKYIASYTLAGAAVTRNAWLRADVPVDYLPGRFPTLDGVSATAPLKGSNLLLGMTVNWAAWAKANPDQRLISLRSVISDDSSAPQIIDHTVPLPPSTTLVLPAPSLSVLPSKYELWLGSQDSQGHRYLSKYSLQ
ncbi:hypothetical protein RQP53_19575 [Paucibacter sp. APW11]|uniref:FAS1 domain-containing protein n=1 Tax=Roseateles aquae TaxID=3077235 RepID=A0ABU3PHK3_9BURK|nr:hypothetical protein [Paucibacter sp. APW11]MDT9001486.1 hypothetical protein [Paucibacter sp. APW11]